MLLFEEFHREAVHDVGDVAGVLHVLAVVAQLRVNDAAMAVVAHPVVIARARPALVAHMPFADMRGAIAALFQFWYCLHDSICSAALWVIEVHDDNIAGLC